MTLTSVFSRRNLLSNEETIGIICVSIIILSINIVLSTSTLLIIIVTGQRTSNTSNRIMFYLTVVDLATAGYRVLIILLVLDHQKTTFSVEFEILVQFITSLVSNMSGYIVVLLALDRYLHVKYLTDITSKFTNTKTDLLTGAAFLTSTLFALTTIIDNLWIQYEALRFVRYSVNGVLLVIAIMLYIMTVRTIKKYKQEAMYKTTLQKLDKTVTMLSSACMFSLTLFFTPINILLVIRALLNVEIWQKCHLELYFHIAILFAQCNTIFNATMYLVVNRKAKKVLFTLFNKDYGAIRK